jgi:hypothetical protein
MTTIMSFPRKRETRHLHSCPLLGVRDKFRRSDMGSVG